jgi:hypothetical protein
VIPALLALAILVVAVAAIGWLIVLEHRMSRRP